ncbi:MAG: Fur family transcriptional regulator [Patescibacteria group bacterium]
MNINSALSSLRNKGYRITKVRKEIVRIFSKSSVPLSAKQIEKIFSKKKFAVNKATIYRELQFLLQNNYLIKVYLHPNEISYESAKLEHHHHLVCNDCGSVDDTSNCVDGKLENYIYKEKGFKIEKHILEFYGTCAQCAKNIK